MNSEQEGIENPRQQAGGEPAPAATPSDEGRRCFLSKAAAAAAAAAAAGGAVILAGGSKDAAAQVLPHRKMTLDEAEAFARDLASVSGVAPAQSEAVLERIDQHLRPLVDESGKLVAGKQVNISLAGSFTWSQDS